MSTVAAPADQPYAVADHARLHPQLLERILVALQLSAFQRAPDRLRRLFDEGRHGGHSDVVVS